MKTGGGLPGGSGRVWGRTTGVHQVLPPMPAPGMLQSVTRNRPTISWQCLGSGHATPVNAFRSGTDGMAAPLPQAAASLPDRQVSPWQQPDEHDDAVQTHLWVAAEHS